MALITSDYAIGAVACGGEGGGELEAGETIAGGQEEAEGGSGGGGGGEEQDEEALSVLKLRLQWNATRR